MVEIEDITCQTCMGQGRIFNTETNDPSERPRWRECPDCNGTGYIDDDDDDEEEGKADG